MDDKSGQKPLRPSSNVVKDMMNTYFKHSDKTPSKESNLDNSKDISIDSDGISSESQIDSESMNNSLVEEKEQIISELISERDELKDKLLRSAAELENFRRRSLKERQEMVEYANERLLYRMLELLDDLGNAYDAAKTNGDPSMLKGIEMIYQKAEKIFNDAGVKRMNIAEGTEFDVNFHEALMHIPSEFPEGTVINVIQSGYMIHERVLRHAKVVTSAGNANE